MVCVSGGVEDIPNRRYWPSLSHSGQAEALDIPELADEASGSNHMFHREHWCSPLLLGIDRHRHMSPNSSW